MACWLVRHRSWERYGTGYTVQRVLGFTRMAALTPFAYRHKVSRSSGEDLLWQQVPASPFSQRRARTCIDVAQHATHLLLKLSALTDWGSGVGPDGVGSGHRQQVRCQTWGSCDVSHRHAGRPDDAHVYLPSVADRFLANVSRIPCRS